jgi:shikimate kinase
VYLRADPAVIADRLVHDSHRRPLLGTEPRTVLDRMFAERDERYAEVADLVVVVDVITAVEAAELILRSGVVERSPPVRDSRRPAPGT